MKMALMVAAVLASLTVAGGVGAEDPSAGVRGPDPDPRGADAPADTSGIGRDPGPGTDGAERRTERPGKHSTTAGQHGTSGEELGGTDTQSGPAREGEDTE